MNKTDKIKNIERLEREMEKLQTELKYPKEYQSDQDIAKIESRIEEIQLEISDSCAEPEIKEYSINNMSSPKSITKTSKINEHYFQSETKSNISVIYKILHFIKNINKKEPATQEEILQLKLEFQKVDLIRKISEAKLKTKKNIMNMSKISIVQNQRKIIPRRFNHNKRNRTSCRF